jgi:hypothetical protein
VIVGHAAGVVADRRPALVAGAGRAAGRLLIQIGTNLHNDVADFERGSDTPERLGPPRVTAMGWLPAAAVRRGAWIAFALAFNFGIYLAYHGGWPIVVIGLASLLAGWAYTGGPRPIAYTPLGECSCCCSSAWWRSVAATTCRPCRSARPRCSPEPWSGCSRCGDHGQQHRDLAIPTPGRQADPGRRLGRRARNGSMRRTAAAVCAPALPGAARRARLWLALPLLYCCRWAYCG